MKNNSAEGLGAWTFFETFCQPLMLDRQTYTTADIDDMLHTQLNSISETQCFDNL